MVNDLKRYLMDNSKTVLITGASSGIGEQFAHVFAKHNFNLVLVARTESKLNSLAEQLKTHYSIAVTIIPVDLSQEHAAREIVAKTDQLKITIDILVNNAGFGTNGKFANIDCQSSLDLIKVNISALTELCRLYLDKMIARNQGKILNVASTAAFQAGPHMAVYCASKAFVLSFSEAIAHEVKDHNINVTVLCPGVTKTNFFERANMHHTKLVNNKFTLMTAEKVAEIGYRDLMRGKRISISGLYNKMLAFSTRLAPRRLTTIIANKLMK